MIWTLITVALLVIGITLFITDDGCNDWLLDSNGDEIALIYQGYNVDLLSDETLHRRVTGIWNDECILNTVNIQIAEEE